MWFFLTIRRVEKVTLTEKRGLVFAFSKQNRIFAKNISNVINPIKKQAVLFLTMAACFLCGLFSGCGNPKVDDKQSLRASDDSLVRTANDIPALIALEKGFKQQGNTHGRMVALRALGQRYREESRFKEALKAHNEGLTLAENAGDTLEWIQALNHIGTNYRRMGLLDMATDYHYRALTLCNESSDTTTIARKNRVVSLNGLGNIYLTLGDYIQADSIFRLALRGEQELNSKLGQAINYANIGSTFLNRMETDSAWVYYKKSMELNRQIHSELGIALCHTYYGEIYEKSQDYEKAQEEYTTAYHMMEKSKDNWHSLQSAISLARIYILTNNDDDAMRYLNRAEQTAMAIHSLEHLAEIHKLYYRLYNKKGNSQLALEHYQKADVYGDSIVSLKKINEIQDTKLAVERMRQTRELNKVRSEYQSERKIKRLGYIVFSILLLLACVFIIMSHIMLRMKNREQRLQHQIQEARERFFTNIAHEFRTPLTVILAAADDIKREGSNHLKDTQRHAEMISRHGSNLLLLVNQMLDIAKLNSTTGVVPQWRRGDIMAFLHMTIDSYRLYAEHKNIRLVFKPSEEKLEMDFVPDYMHKIISNLVSNGIKFAKQNTDIVISALHRQDMLKIIIADIGLGMTEEQQQHIFEPFFQGAQDSQNIGTGIGLSLVKLATDAMKGTIHVDSTLGQGTTFTLVFPLKHGLQQWEPLEQGITLPEKTMLQTDSPETQNDEGDDESTRILIIEDVEDVAEYMARQLNCDYSIYYAPNGEVGLKKAHELVPDLIITDIMMPGIDGLEVCRQVRKDQLLSHIPVIMVTAKITLEDRLQGLKAGADAYLEKPFNGEELRVRVDNLLQQRQQLRKRFSQETEEEKNNQMSQTDRDFLNKLERMTIERIESHQLNLTELASALFITRTQLNRKIKAITGFSTSTFVTDVRVKKAKALLTSDPSIPIGEVAYKCGIEDVSYFTSLFKRITGFTPSQYREDSNRH